MSLRLILVAAMVLSQLALGALDMSAGRYRIGALAWCVSVCNLLSMGVR